MKVLAIHSYGHQMLVLVDCYWMVFIVYQKKFMTSETQEQYRKKEILFMHVKLLQEMQQQFAKGKSYV